MFIFTLLCGTQKRFHLFEAPKRSENKKFVISLSYSESGWQELRLGFC